MSPAESVRSHISTMDEIPVKTLIPSFPDLSRIVIIIRELRRCLEAIREVRNSYPATSPNGKPTLLSNRSG